MENEVFGLRFAQGCILLLKRDWFEDSCALIKLFWYLLSESAKVGAVQAYLHNIHILIRLGHIFTAEQHTHLYSQDRPCMTCMYRKISQALYCHRYIH